MKYRSNLVCAVWKQITLGYKLWDCLVETVGLQPNKLTASDLNGDFTTFLVCLSSQHNAQSI